MDLALAQAAIAGELGEVPVGAVVVCDGEVVGRGHNRREVDADPLGHAEIAAIREAAAAVGRWRLFGCTVYVTVEPCPMCAGAIYQARLTRLVFGCPDPKAGAVGSLFNIAQDERLNHWVEVTSGVRAEESAALLTDFFQQRR